MCGIAGIFRYAEHAGSPLDERVGRQMLDAISHRGPDDGGLLVGSHVLLGHRRLSILDLSAAGHQPMADEAQSCWIVFNGEIYNFRELRTELETCGHTFLSNTDTEVLLHGYLEWGHDIVHRLNGMFAFAIYDHREESLWLVRDPVGIKPLFYSDLNGSLKFGSEIKAILADPSFPRQPDWRALDRFFTFGYTPAPHTGFANVSQLMPGEWIIARKGQIIHQQWYDLPIAEPSDEMSLDEAAERFDSVLDAAVKRQMVSDVPLGAFLSGGLDSSAIVRSMRRTGASEIESFTIGFEEASFDESSYAQEVAARFETRHHSKLLNETAAASLLHTIISHAEEPFADNSSIPVYCLAAFTREHVTVALAGDGADELLAGYDTYRASAVAPHFRRLPAIFRNALTAAVERMPASTAKYGRVSIARRFMAGASLPFPYDHCSWRRYVSAHLRQRLYTDKYLALVDEADPLDDYAGLLQEAPEHLSPLEQQLYLDFRFHLPNDMLVKVDRMSMAHSLEVRVPFLDLEVVKAAQSIPAPFKRQGRDGKRILKRMLEKDLPANIVHRKKAGFLIPIEKWLGTDCQLLLHQILTPDFIESTGMLRYGPINEMIKQQKAGKADLAYPLYALLVFGIWWRIWISCEVPPTFNKSPVAPVEVVYLPSSEID